MHSRLFFELDLGDPAYAALRAAILGLMRNPVPESEFDLKTRDFRDRPEPEVWAESRRRGYDALLLFVDGRFVALAAYEMQQDGPHMFREYVPENERGHGYSHELLRIFGELFSLMPNIPGFWWGFGQDDAPKRNLQALREGRIKFPFRYQIERGHYVRYLDK